MVFLVCFVCGFFSLFCQRTEREGHISTRARMMRDWGSHEGRGCSVERGSHRGGPSALSRPPPGDKLPVPRSAPRTPVGEGQGGLVQPRCCSAVAEPPVLGCTEPRAHVLLQEQGEQTGPVRPLSGVRGEEPDSGPAASPSGQGLPRAPSADGQGLCALPCTRVCQSFVS